MKKVPTVDEVMQHIETEAGPIPPDMYEAVHQAMKIIVGFARRGKREKAEEFIRSMGGA